MASKEILEQIDQYYTGKIKQYGATPKGVDWNGEESQYLRFEQLCKVFKEKEFSILDYGCGFGSLYKFLKNQDYSFQYSGFDISEEMINKAKLANSDGVQWFTKINPLLKYDYAIASGIFNVKLDTKEAEWLKLILDTLEQLNQASTKGFSFNMLTSYSDKPLMKEYLYYAKPEFFFEHCKKNYAKNVALLHDYNLYEFSIIVKK
ncbi:class I SAM-dependent methyltransferase [Pedobacter arcticus]|uniref:class I SAM-dependent methyltransferase n=1 Tax=Pedobacter arcticus TaxID=752140 RepID=UPI00030547E1|nr:class I SAM-dependent methyltransferase [Pedobacter arcticus]